VAGSLFVCKIVPALFVWLFESINFNNIVTAYAFFYSITFVSLYLLAVFFIAPSYITGKSHSPKIYSRYHGLWLTIKLFVVPSCIVKSISSFLRRRKYQARFRLLNSKIKYALKKKILHSLIWFAFHYFFAFIVLFTIYTFFDEPDYLFLKSLTAVLSNIAESLHIGLLVVLLNLSGFYGFSCYMVICYSIAGMTAKIFQYHLWRIKDTE
jgi:hypothetical protein